MVLVLQLPLKSVGCCVDSIKVLVSGGFFFPGAGRSFLRYGEMLIQKVAILCYKIPDKAVTSADSLGSTAMRLVSYKTKITSKM